MAGADFHAVPGSGQIPFAKVGKIIMLLASECFTCLGQGVRGGISFPSVSSPLPPLDETRSLLPISEALISLAPTHLPNLRQERYMGDDLCIRFTQLAARDQALLGDLYTTLLELLAAIPATSTDDAAKWREIQRWTQRHNVGSIIDEVREFGAASYAADGNEARAGAIHDIRGGALGALLGRLQFSDQILRNADQLETLFVLVRDHLKIIRNAVVGLDDARRDDDRRRKSHGMDLALAKWHDSVVGPNWQDRPVRMFVDCRYTGALTECCLESAAMDRIFYNLANNACRHAVGDRLDMAIFPVPDSSGECLRFVLSNEVTAEDAAFLHSLPPAGGGERGDLARGRSLPALFELTVSSTGSGFGLTVVADFVARAFGLQDRGEALRGGYVGAILDGNMFRAWFHWPIADREEGPGPEELRQAGASPGGRGVSP